jgi:hypothetical protein
VNSTTSPVRVLKTQNGLAILCFGIRENPRSQCEDFLFLMKISDGAMLLLCLCENL